MPLGDMVLSCDITIDGDRHAEFVLFPNALYVSPDETVASVSSALAWCNKCGGFCAAERIDTEKATRDLLNKSLDDDLPDFHDFIFENDPHAIEKFRDSLRRTLHWMTLRKDPPKCLGCSSTDIEIIGNDTGESFVDKLGRTCKYATVFASTSINHRLYVYDTECNLIAEISRICPQSSDFIDDAYEYNSLVEIANGKT